MSQKLRDLKWFGLTLPDSKSPRLVYKFWGSCDQAIESSGLTTIEGSPPNVGKASGAIPSASPPLGDGVPEGKDFFMKIIEMKRSKTGAQSGMKCALA